MTNYPQRRSACPSSSECKERKRSIIVSQAKLQQYDILTEFNLGSQYGFHYSNKPSVVKSPVCKEG